jgi:hypothetical protein
MWPKKRKINLTLKISSKITTGGCIPHIFISCVKNKFDVIINKRENLIKSAH